MWHSMSRLWAWRPEHIHVDSRVDALCAAGADHLVLLGVRGHRLLLGWVRHLCGLNMMMLRLQPIRSLVCFSVRLLLRLLLLLLPLPVTMVPTTSILF